LRFFAALRMTLAVKAGVLINRSFDSAQPIRKTLSVPGFVF